MKSSPAGIDLVLVSTICRLRYFSFSFYFIITGDGHVSINEFLTHWGALKLTAVDHTINIGSDNITTQAPDTTTHGHRTTIW